MRTGTSFARNWQLIKVARSLRQHDVAGPLIQRLLKDASPDLEEQIAAIAGQLGEEDGLALRARSEAGFDAPTLMEGLLLMWGIPCESREEHGEGITITLLCDGTAIREVFADERVAAPYLASYSRALQQDAAFERGADGRMIIRFPPPG
ncbi:MAG: hypothetical protein GX216_04215 [Methanomicrobiales archaeon]|jgi:hypothetical protein|nr:hypothetical protein [Methanomicrobiales archaeon]